MGIKNPCAFNIVRLLMSDWACFAWYIYSRGPPPNSPAPLAAALKAGSLFQDCFYPDINLSNNVSICLSVHASACPSIYPYFYLPTYRHTYLSVCVSILLPTHHHTYLTVWLSVNWFCFQYCFYPHINLPTNISICLSNHVSMCISVYPFVYLHTYRHTYFSVWSPLFSLPALFLSRPQST